MWKYLLTISVATVLSTSFASAADAPFDPAGGDSTSAPKEAPVASAVSEPAMAQPKQVSKDPRRIWLTENKRAKVKIDHCKDNAQALCGEIIWLKEPKNEKGQDKTDVHNPDPALQSRPVMGLHMLKNFVKGDGEWVDGEIYNPQNGKTYSCTMSVNNDGTLKVHGYVGIELLGETQYWTPSN